MTTATKTQTSTNPAPLLKWAGGKRQLLSTILPAFPADFDLTTNRYFEPFMGGAAVMWALSTDPAAANLRPTARKTGRPIVVSDVNPELTNLMKVVQDEPVALLSLLHHLELDTTESAYYSMRASEPSSAVERAARTIYLNKTCFNGLYRCSSKGFNVSYGKVERSSITDNEVLLACSRWLSHVEIRTGSFMAALADAQPGDVVLCDPPYVPLSPTASFTKYAADDFTELDQCALAGVIRGLIRRGVRVILTNSNTALTRLIYGDDLHLFAVSASRTIGASSASRARVEEVLGLSYDPSLARDSSVLAGLRCLTPPTGEEHHLPAVAAS